MSNTISPAFSIKSRSVVPEVNQLFSLSKSSDVDGLLLGIDGLDGYGNTSLRLLACHDCAATTATLIQHGTDPDISERFGETPLQGAVFENAHEAITQLLTAGADYTLKTIFGNTIMHWAANEADPQTLKLLSEAQMRGVDVDAKNADGIAATELAATRCEHDAALRASFTRLVNSLSDEQDEDEELGSFVSGTSGEESWKSVEDIAWHEANWAVEADVRDKETIPEGTDIEGAFHWSAENKF